MADLSSLVQKLQDEGKFKLIATNPLAQFRDPQQATRRYYGAELLPEMMKESNMYRETDIRFRTIIANDGSHYSPTQKKDGDLFGYLDVHFGDIDIKRELTAEKYDAIVKLLADGNTNNDIAAVARIIRWTDTVLNLALKEKQEKQRWEAIVSAQVTRAGDNGYNEIVKYSNPAGHRVAASDTWSDDAFDPFEDIFDMAQVLWDKGYVVDKTFTSRKVASKLGKNAKVRARVGRAIVDASGQIQGTSGRADIAAINQSLSADGLPPITLYDLQYRTQTGTGRFLPDDVFVMIASTGRTQEIDIGDVNPLILVDTLGYYGVGKSAGQPNPGAVIQVESHTSKPPRLEGEGYLCGLPVIQEPEAIGVIKEIS
jgi:hypothetical protein